MRGGSDRPSRRAGFRLHRIALALLLALPLPAACAGGLDTTSSTSSTSDAGDGAGADAGADATGSHVARRREDGGARDASEDVAEAPIACATEVQAFAPDPPGMHVPICSVCTWSTNPPTSGVHYPVWAAFKTYAEPIPPGFWVHDLEHGAIVVTYDCPGGCNADLARLEAFLAARPDDPVCGKPMRVVVTPYPDLDVRFAASAWGVHLRSSCFDLEALGDFMRLYYGHGPEPNCEEGTDLTARVPPGCGEPIDAGGADASGG